MDRRKASEETGQEGFGLRLGKRGDTGGFPSLVLCFFKLSSPNTFLADFLEAKREERKPFLVKRSLENTIKTLVLELKHVVKDLQNI